MCLCVCVCVRGKLFANITFIKPFQFILIQLSCKLISSKPKILCKMLLSQKQMRGSTGRTLKKRRQQIESSINNRAAPSGCVIFYVFDSEQWQNELREYLYNTHRRILLTCLVFYSLRLLYCIVVLYFGRILINMSIQYTSSSIVYRNIVAMRPDQI